MGTFWYNIYTYISERVFVMDKKAFALVRNFFREKPAQIIGLVVLMLILTFGERELSDILTDADLVYADYGLAVIRMILQSALSTALVLSWHKREGNAAPFSAVDILKVFVPTLLMTVSVTFCIVLVVTIPLGVWLYLRTDFFMNFYITGRSNGVFSCVGASFRATKGMAKRYFAYNLKYLSFYFLVEVIMALFVAAQAFQAVSAQLSWVLDCVDAVFLSLFMPYRYLIKCAFYSVYLHKEKKNG